MLIFSFICSILFSIVLISFSICLIIITLRQKKVDKEVSEFINGFDTLDLNSVGGADDKEKE